MWKSTYKSNGIYIRLMQIIAWEAIWNFNEACGYIKNVEWSPFVNYTCPWLD
jgi:hypothetical protein